VTGDELAPGGDDPRRVAPDRCHVGELNMFSVGTQMLPEQVDFRRAHHHQNRVPAAGCVPDERPGHGHEVIGSRVEHGLMAILAYRPMERRLSHSHRHLPAPEPTP
jgi:hypothetical protein